jgi:hypothetical protein
MEVTAELTAELRGYAKLCHLAYQPESKAIAAYKLLSWSAELLVQSSPIERIYILRSPTEILFVICGSNDLGDWLCNLSAQPNALVHPGYSYTAKHLILPIKAAIDRPIVKILGHSKGGAVAAVLGQYLFKLQPEITSFGAPRIGNQKFAETYQAQYRRVVHAWDIVARLPFHWMGYRHGGDPLLWDGKNFVQGVEAWKETQRLYSTATLMVRPWRSVMAHFSYWR